MKKIDVPIIVTIAGSDSSGGAGIQADIKTISALGGYAASVITAITAQNTQGVQAIEPVSPDFILQQMESVFSDLSVAAVKIGMLHDEAVIAALAHGLQTFKPEKVVLDPVMVAKSGHALLQPTTLESLKKKLFPQVSLLTPNIPEAEKLLNKSIRTSDEQEQAAREAGQLFQTNVLLKGGHFTGDKSSDVLYLIEDARLVWFHADRVETGNTHGTGCTLSSAIATYLGRGFSLNEAVSLAKNYLTHALLSSKHQTIGKGSGPVDHFYFLREQHNDF
ncbi:MAG TPA: bifunctional hydroxymethylpyrimidine kinase/phosphomethylpyrimidine kinase [Gammaproteobacteria bacterium]|nr:bifunctional hydroxymethylpyrimidine kinase/phosphomethylpyrimidine kinase [Gammaproteobacteria bacterium]